MPFIKEFSLLLWVYVWQRVCFSEDLSIYQMILISLIKLKIG